METKKKTRDIAIQTDFDITAKIIAANNSLLLETKKFNDYLLGSTFKLLHLKDVENFGSFKEFEEEVRKKVNYWDILNKDGDKTGWEIGEDELD